MATRKAKLAAHLGDGDVVATIADEPAFMALVDVASYAKDLPDWDYASLARRILDEMSAGHVVAWGCPGVEVSVRLTHKPLGARVAARSDATTSGTLTTTGGALCLASYTSLTMCAQFAKEKLPQRRDARLTVAPGSYRVDVHRFFAHRRGAPFPVGELPDGDHYVVVLTPASPPRRATRAREIAWAPRLA